MRNDDDGNYRYFLSFDGGAVRLARLLIHRQIKLMIGLPKSIYIHTPPAESRHKMLVHYIPANKSGIEEGGKNTNNIYRKREERERKNGK